ncbi:hypothetical protein [Salinisphaera sp. T31B1]|uniref:hypothetical protein n=1 Tax=Salinisphaera sp. T31B1 TaxID=727963 RepID=UPI0033418AA5
MSYDRSTLTRIAAGALCGIAVLSGGAAVAAGQSEAPSAEQHEPSDNGDRMSYDHATRKQTDDRAKSDTSAAPADPAKPNQDAGTTQGSDYTQ